MPVEPLATVVVRPVPTTAPSGRAREGWLHDAVDQERPVEQQLWVLDGDEESLATSDQASAGDLIVRRTASGAEVGELVDTGTPHVRWWGEVDEALLPTEELDGAVAEEATPLRRIDGSTDLRRAIDGVQEAQRHRGG